MTKGADREVLEFTAESRMRDVRQFVGDAIADLRRAPRVARYLVRQRLAVQYRHSTLGFFWAFMPVIVTAVVLGAGQKARILDGIDAGVPLPFFGIFGVALAQVFLESFNVQRTLFGANRHLLTQQGATVEALILTGLGESLIGTGVRVVVLTAVFVYYGVAPSAWIPVGVLLTCGIAVLASALGLLASPWSALTRDADQIMRFAPWLIFVAAPVFVPLSHTSRIYAVIRWNPLTPLFEAVRSLSYGSGAGLGTAIVGLASAAALLLLGWGYARIACAHVIERSLD